MYSELHASYNSLLYSTNTRDTANKNTTIFRREKKFCFIYEYCQRSKFSLETKYKHLCVCSQIFLHLENYHNRLEHCFLVNCIISILLRQGFISIFGVFPLINPKSNTIILKVADYNSKNF